MVDAVVSYVVERLGDYLIQEAVFLPGVKNEVQLLKNELEWMACFIKDAEEKQIQDAMIRKWVCDIRDLAYDTEDILDTFMLKVHVNEGGISERRPVSVSFIKSVSRKFKVRINLCSIGKEIKELRKRISDLSRKRESYRLEDLGNTREGRHKTVEKLKELRRATSFTVEENMVGFQDEANKLLGKLLENEPRRLVISIFGMGGLGKTMLVLTS